MLISFSLLALAAHLLLLSPLGFREPKQIHRIVRDKARVKGAMASIVEWQSLAMQEYRYSLLVLFLQHRGKVLCTVWCTPANSLLPVPAPAGDYDHALHVDHPEAPSLLEQYLDHEGGRTAPGRETKGNRLSDRWRRDLRRNIEMAKKTTSPQKSSGTSAQGSKARQPGRYLAQEYNVGKSCLTPSQTW